MSYLAKEFDERIISLLKGGGVGFMPSDTIYGLSCIALNESAVKKQHKLKDRDSHKPFIVLISDIKMLDLLSIDKSQTSMAQKYWPGALTLICKASQTPVWLQLGTKSLAVRIPDDKKLCCLIDQVGPIVSTSANKEGQKPATSAAEAKETFKDNLDFYVDIGKIVGQPSTMVRPVDSKLQVLRSGAVKIDKKEQQR